MNDLKIVGRMAQTPHQLHADLSRFNNHRLSPQPVFSDWQEDIRAEAAARLEEGHYVESERANMQAAVAAIPLEPDAFMDWFEALRDHGPGQHDPLFPWLRDHATLDQMRWFLTQEAAGEAGFEDLVAMTQVKLPARPKLEMAANYWDEMGRGHERGMHGPMLDTVVRELDLHPSIEATVWESLALANLMVALAANRRYTFQSVGALGVIEMTAPSRVSLVNEGLRRLDVPTAARKYFQLHAGLDIQHSKTWNQEVIRPLVEADPALARALGEGALLRLSAGARCFARYRAHFGFDEPVRVAA